MLSQAAAQMVRQVAASAAMDLEKISPRRREFVKRMRDAVVPCVACERSVAARRLDPDTGRCWACRPTVPDPDGPPGGQGGQRDA